VNNAIQSSHCLTSVSTSHLYNQHRLEDARQVSAFNDGIRQVQVQPCATIPA